MISTTEAKRLILRECKPATPVTLSLSNLTNEVLAKDIRNPTDSPPFHQSAMDGYAIRWEDANQLKQLEVTGEIVTGRHNKQRVKAGTAMRIFTGAAIPAGADTVVMQEHCLTDGKRITLTQLALLKKGANIRLQGSQIKKGVVALHKGHQVNPVTVAYLATLGINKVAVFPKPSVAVVATGNELQLPGKKLTHAQIYESNTFALQALLKNMHLAKPKIVRVKDEAGKTERVLREALAAKDILLVTGGISVGDYDLVAPALKKIGVKTIFHKVAQRPGKPFYFGKKGNKLVFALPGNPASVITCFLEYVQPALLKRMGESACHAPVLQARSKNDYIKKTGLTHYLKAVVTTEGEVEILPGQESYLLHTFSLANCLVEVAAESNGFKAGDVVPVHLFNPLF